MKAMLLAAGRGARMQHLTENLPKPLITVGDLSLIEHNIIKLKKVGVSDIVINVAYCAKQIIAQLGEGEKYGVNIVYSYENNGPIGTGAGIQQALPLLGDKPFILLSGDIWTDYPFKNLLKESPQLAHLVMVENPTYNHEGDFGLGGDGLLHLNPPKLTYGNIAVLHPQLFVQTPKGESSLAPLLQLAIAKGAVTGELYSGAWFNVGTPEELTRLRNFHT